MSRVGTRFHLAVVDGPDGGWVLPLPEDRAVVVGRGRAADLSLDDPSLSRRHLEIRVRRGRIVVRAAHRRGGASLRRARRRRTGQVRLGRPRRLGSGWRAVPAGSRLRVGETVAEVREHPGLAPSAAPPPELTEGLGMRLLIPLAMAASMIPLALTSSGSSPWRTVTWLVLPVVLVLAVVWPWLRERARGRRRLPTQTRDPSPPPDPAGLFALVDHPWRSDAVDWDVGSSGSGRRRRARTLAPPEPGHGLALVGPAPAVGSMARWLVCQLAHRSPASQLRLQLPDDWDWALPLPQANPGPAGERRTVVVHDRTSGAAPPPLAADAVGLVLATTLADVPGWCSRVVEVEVGHDRRVGVAWASEVAAALHGVTAAADGLPDLVPLPDLLEASSPDQVLQRWRSRPDGLAAPLGVAASGPVWLDLADGPHALVAGTTGAGKSELLTTWVLGLALRHPPSDLHVLLVDYKGGATFGALAALPHVVGVLTDLDAGATARALASLRAELSRRERVLADAGARSLPELLARSGRLPRLLVVVDEFRTLADSHPELLDGLVRLAAQGRSLGIHLVLATQRPGGAVTADMRANIAVRLCLRVLEQTDSLDVLGTAAAALLPAVPGRAVLRTEASTTLQVAWPGTVDDGVARLVELATAAAALAEHDPELLAVTPPWAPPLPAAVGTATLPGVGPDALPLLLTDRPDQQRLDGWHLPLGESLLISGPPGSGRSTAARTLATEAVRRGVVTHVIAAEPLCPPQAPARGTVTGPEDVRRAVALLTLLTQPRPGAELLVLDDVDALCQAVDAVHPFGTGQELLTSLLRAARRHHLGVVLTAVPPATRWAALVRTQLVLRPRDAGDALVAGIPRDLVDLRAPTGRGVVLDGGTALAGQVALADGGGAGWPSPTRSQERIEPLPDLVALPSEWGVPGALLVGLGGTGCAPVHARWAEAGTWLVLGSARTGRTTALRMLAARLRAAGRSVTDDPAAVRRGGVLVVDDVDRLAPAAGTAIAEASVGVALLAAARPEALQGAYHDLARRLRDPDVTLVLGAPAGTAPWVGLDLRAVADQAHRPGRGVLVARGAAVAVQVDRGASAQITGPEDDGLLVAATEAGSSRPAPTTNDASRVG